MTTVDAARLARIAVLGLGTLSGAVAARSDVSATQGHPAGVDLSRPAQEAFAGWPPDRLREQSYWLPWDPMAFNRAALFGRPVLFVLSVDWSRDGAKWLADTLSAPDVARALNGSYVTVLANADMRPDLRERYQTGAWPAVAFLLPTGDPMLSRVGESNAAPITASRVDRESLRFLLREGNVYWNRRAADLIDAGRAWREDEGPLAPTPGAPSAAASDQLVEWLLERADRQDGGFGIGPKFLIASTESYAGWVAARGNPTLRDHSRFSLERLAGSSMSHAAGGLYRLAAEAGLGGIQREKLLTVNASWIEQLAVSLRFEPSADLTRALQRANRFVMTRLGRKAGGFYNARMMRDDGPADAALDPLVLAGPNATAGAALVRAGVWLNDDDAIAAGLGALELVHDAAYLPELGVRHSIEPPTRPRLFLVTQAEVALAFADAYETTGDRRYLDAARNIVDVSVARLKDRSGAGLLDVAARGDDLGLLKKVRRPLRANARMARAMIRLDWHGLGSRYRDAALDILSYYSGEPTLYGVHGIELGLAMEEISGDRVQVLLDGSPDDPKQRSLRRAAVNAAAVNVTIVAGDAHAEVAATVVSPGGDPVRITDVAELKRALRP